MKKAIIGLVLAAFLIAGGVFVFMKTGAQSNAASLAPLDSDLFVNIPNIPRTGFRFTTTAIARIIGEPEVQAFLDQPLKKLKANPSAGSAGSHLVAIKPGNIFLCGKGTEGGEAKLLLGVQFWGGQKDFEKGLANLRAELGGGTAETESHNGIDISTTTHGDHDLHAAVAGRWGFLSNDKDLVRAALDRVTARDKSPSLLDDPRFKSVADKMPEDCEVLLFLRPQKILPNLLHGSEGDQSATSGAEGLKSLDALGAALKIDGLLLRETVFVLQPEKDLPAPLALEALDLTTKDSAVFADFRFDTTKLPDMANLLANSSPLAAGLLQSTASTLAKAYGPEFSFIVDWRESGTAPTAFLAATIKDKQANKELLASISGGAQVFSLPAGPANLSIGSNERFLIAGMDAETVSKKAGSSGGTETLRDAPAFKAVEPMLKSANQAVVYVDTAAVFARLYNSFLPLVRLGAMVMPNLNTYVDLAKLPKAETITQHLKPTTLSQTRTPEGTLIETSGPVGVSQLLLLGGAGNMAYREISGQQ